MKPRRLSTARLSLPLATAIAALLAAPSLHATNYYWDTNGNGSGSGLGNVAGVWGTSAFEASIAATSVLDGSITGVSAATTTSDWMMFGTTNLALGSTASSIGIATDGVNIGNISFGVGQTNSVTLGTSGNMGNITLNTTSSIVVNNASDTIGVVLAGTGISMTKAGAGTLTLTGANTYTGTTIIGGGGSLVIGNGSTGSLNGTTGTALTFSANTVGVPGGAAGTGGGGLINFQEAVGSTQGMGALTASGGDGTIQSTFNATSAAVTFSSLGTRTAGATLNFVTSGGTNGSTNSINLTGKAAGFIDQATFFGGSNYAWMNAAGSYVRGINYSGDTGAATSAGTTTLAGTNYQQITGAVTAQNTATFLTMADIGSYNLTLASAQTLTVNGLLQSGGTSVFSGGTGIQAASGAEMVIRTNLSGDSLTISTPILANGSNALTKSGAGTLVLSGTNTYTGTTTINSGILAVSGGNAIADGNSVVLANAAGATLRLDSNETITNLSGGGLAGGNVNVQGNTLTLGGTNSNMTFDGTISGTGGITKVGTGTLTLSRQNSFAGTTTVTGGALTFTFSTDGSASSLPISTGGAFAMAGGTTLNFSPGAILLAIGQLGAQFNGPPNGYTVGNSIQVNGGTVNLSAFASFTNDSKMTFSGGVTGGTSGAQTLNFITNPADRNDTLFSGVIADGSAGGTLGLNFAINGSVSPNYASLSGQNTFTGPITVTTSAIGGVLAIGGEKYNSGSVAGSGYLGGGNYTNTISLGNLTTLDYLSSANQTLGGVISGAGSVLKEGSGNLTLSVANTFTGTTTVSLGKIILGNAQALQNSTYVTTGSNGTIGIDLTGYTTPTLGGLSGSVNLASAFAGGYSSVSNLTLNPQTGTSASYSGNIANGAMILTKTGAGTQALTGTNTYSGGTTLTNGTLQFGKLVSQPATGVVAVGTGATLAVNLGGSGEWTTGTSGNGTIGGLLAGSGGQGGGTVTYTGTVALGLDTTNASGGAQNYGGIIGNVGTTLGMTKLGTGTLVLSGANTYTGPTTLTAGTLSVGATNNLGGATSNLVFNGGTLQITGTTLTNFTGIGHTVAFTSGQAVVLDIADTGNTFTADLALTQGAGALTKNGIGTLVLNQANTYTGASTLTGGGGTTLDYTSQNNNKLSTAALTLTGAGTVTMKGGSFTQVVASTALNAGGTFLARNTGTSKLQMAAIIRAAGGTISFADATIATVNTANVNSILGGYATLGNDWAVGGASNTAVTALSSYTGTLPTITGVNTANYTLTGDQTQSGAVLANTVKITGSGALDNTLALGTSALTITSTSATALGGILYVGGGTNNYNITSTSGTGLDASAAFDLVITTVTGTLNVSANINGSNAARNLVKTGAGKLVVSSANAYTGGTYVNQGVLQLANATAAGTTAGGIVVQNGAALELANSAVIGAKALTITGTGVSSAGALRNIASNTSSYAGAITIGNGGAQINSDSGAALTLSGGVVTAATSNATFGGAGNTTLSTAAISGAGGIVKNDAGTLTLNFTNTYTGGTNINSGTLSFANGSLGTTGSITFTGNSTLQWASTNTQDISSRLVMSNSVNSNFDTVGNTVTFASAIGGSTSGSLTKTGTGTLTLSGINTYTGGTTLKNGKLVLDTGANRLVSTGSVVLGDSGTTGKLVLGSTTAANQTLTGLTTTGLGGSVVGGYTSASTLTLNISGSNAFGGTLGGAGTNENNLALTSTGAGTLTLTGSNSYSGGTNINAGTLAFASGSLGSSGSITFTGNSTLQWASSNTQDLSSRLVMSNSVNSIFDTNGNNVTFASAIGSTTSGSLTKAGSGTLALSSTDTYSGGTNINAGTLSFASGSLGSSGSITFTGNGSLQWASGNTQDISSRLVMSTSVNSTFDTQANNVTFASAIGSSTSGSLTKAGSGTLQFNSLNTYSGGTTINAGTLTTAVDVGAADTIGGALLAGGPITINQGATLLFKPVRQSNQTHPYTATNNISLSGGAGTVNLGFGPENDTKFALSGSVTGATGVAQTLAITQAYGGGGGDRQELLFSGNIANGSGGTLGVSIDFQGNSGAGNAFVNLQGQNTFTGDLTLTNTANLNSGAWVTIGGERYVGYFTGSAATVGTGYLGSGADYSGAISISNGTSGLTILSFLTSANQILRGVISGTGSLQQNGTGTLTLTAANTFTGTTTVTGGKIILGNAQALQNSTYVTTGSNGTSIGIDLNGYTSPTLGGLSGAVNLASAFTGGYGSVTNLTLNPQTGASATYSGVIANGASGITVTKTGAGTQTLSGSNTYTGATTIKAGTLVLDTGANRLLSTGTVVLGDTGTTGKFVLGGTTVADQTLTGLTTSGSGGSVVGGNASNSTLTLNISGANTFGGTLGGAGTNENKLALTKTGTGTLTLTAANTYTGATTVSNGTLAVTGSLAAGSGVAVNGGKLTGTGTINGTVAVAASATLAPTAQASGSHLTVGATTFTAGSIFEWDMSPANPAVDPGSMANNQGSYGQVAAGTTTGTSVFTIVLGSGGYGSSFWDTNKTWSNIYSASNVSNLASLFTTFGGTNVSSTGVVSGQGYFSFNGGTALTWTAVPEPTSALAGLLLGAGLLRRRRK